MNEITAFFLLIAILSLLVHATNIIICLKQWIPMKKGKAEKRPFITKTNWMILRGATIVLFVAVTLFCVFYNTDVMGKVKLFAIILLVILIQPCGLLAVMEYIYLFRENKAFEQNAASELIDREKQ